MKGILARTAIALSPVVMIAGLTGAASASVTPNSGESVYITHYSDYLNNSTQQTGNPVTFHNFGGQPNNAAVWNLKIFPSVTATWPFIISSPSLCSSSGGALCNDEVVELVWGTTPFAAGTTNDLEVVLRPASDGNYWVVHPLSGGTYELINVHATNDDRGGPICLADNASDTQASLVLCPHNGTMTVSPS